MTHYEFTIKKFFSSNDIDIKIESGETGIFSPSDKKFFQKLIADATYQHRCNFLSSYILENNKEFLVIKRILKKQI